jgi:hypothetical protein
MARQPRSAARPRKLFLIGEMQAKGVMEESERFEHVKINIAKVEKRLPPVTEQPHDKTALIIVCYGPSLNDTWTDLVGS